MKSLVRIVCILLYILFTQVYPVVHWHAHEHQDEIELHVCTHPPDLLTNETKNDHDHSCNHEHKDTHFNGDWDYTFKTKTYRLKIIKQQLVNINNICEPYKVYYRNTLEIESKLTHYHLPLIIPDRAPPQLS